MTTSRLSFVVALALPVGALLAQEPPRTPVPVPPADVAPTGSLRPVPARDPFRGPPRLEGASYGAPMGETGAPRVAPPATEVRLMGLIRVTGRAPGALLQVGREDRVVRTGDRLGSVVVLEVGASSVRLLVDGEERDVR